MEDVAKLETRVALLETGGEQKYWNIKLLRALIIVLLVALAVVLTGIVVKDHLESRKENNTLKLRQTEPPKTSSRPQTEWKTETSSKPTTMTTTKFQRVYQKGVVYGHLVPHKGQRKGKTVQWDSTPPSFLSPNGVRLYGNQTIIRFGTGGVYRFSISLSVYSGEAHSQAFNNRIRLKMYVNNAPKPIREIESVATGTLSDSFLWKMRFRDSITFHISDVYWSLHHTKTSFDFNLISDLE